MKNFSQTFVRYHGCGNSFIDGTNILLETGEKCFLETYNPFWKKPFDSCNKIGKSTRNKLKAKTRAEASYMRKYFKNCSLNCSDYDTDDESSDDESGSNMIDYESEIVSASETE